MRRAIPAWLLCGLVPLAHAAHPLLTEDAGTQEPGKQQVELNTDWIQKPRNTDRVGAFTYTYGLREGLDLFATAPFTLSSPAGMNDVSLGVKWKMLETGRTSFALKPELFLPSGDEHKSLGTGLPGLTLTLVSSTEAAPWIFHANLALTLNHYRMDADRAANRNVRWRVSGAVEYFLAEKWQLVGDVGMERAQENDSNSHPVYLLMGAIYSPQQNVDLDAGVKFNRHCGNCATPGNRQFGVGLTWRF
jgi:hypothetical protein